MRRGDETRMRRAVDLGSRHKQCRALRRHQVVHRGAGVSKDEATQSHDTARKVLTENRDRLEVVTRRLLEIEVMEGDELRQLLRIPPKPEGEGAPLPPADQPVTNPPM